MRNEDKEIHSAADRILKEYNLTSLLVTRSEKGMSYIAPDASQDIPTEAREVYDVSGAGDTVVATLAAALAAGIPIADAIYLANKAAGIVVGKIGTSPILFKELQDELQIGKPASKLIPISQLADTIKQLRAQERKIIFTNGCFDILHKGHVCYLEKAKRLGDVLIVGLNSDSSVKRLKGESRPINDESARSTVLAALEAVDYVVIFTEDTPLNLIKTVAPDVLVKGGVSGMVHFLQYFIAFLLYKKPRGRKPRIVSTLIVPHFAPAHKAQRRICAQKRRSAGRGGRVPGGSAFPKCVALRAAARAGEAEPPSGRTARAVLALGHQPTKRAIFSSMARVSSLEMCALSI